VTRLYVSGPMTGIPEFNYPAFHDAKERLTLAGFTVLSPADLPIRDDWEWIDYIVADIEAVFVADGVATLPGFETSKGARIECAIAQHRQIPIGPVDEWLRFGKKDVA
jgi:hypothetical protein